MCRLWKEIANSIRQKQRREERVERKSWKLYMTEILFKVGVTKASKRYKFDCLIKNVISSKSTLRYARIGQLLDRGMRQSFAKISGTRSTIPRK